MKITSQISQTKIIGGIKMGKVKDIIKLVGLIIISIIVAVITDIFDPASDLQYPVIDTNWISDWVSSLDLPPSLFTSVGVFILGVIILFVGPFILNWYREREFLSASAAADSLNTDATPTETTSRSAMRNAYIKLCKQAIATDKAHQQTLKDIRIKRAKRAEETDGTPEANALDQQIQQLERKRDDLVTEKDNLFNRVQARKNTLLEIDPEYFKKLRKY